jgi:hypothetical protein
MATFQKRSSNWRAIVTKKGFGRLTKTLDTKAEAEAWTPVVESEMARGVFVSRKEAENTTLSEALDRYDREVTINKKNPRSERIYAKTWKKAFGSRSLASLNSTDIAKFRDDRLKTVSANMVRLELALLSHLFTIAIKEWGMTGLVNPVGQIRVNGSKNSPLLGKRNFPPLVVKRHRLSTPPGCVTEVPPFSFPSVGNSLP